MRRLWVAAQVALIGLVAYFVGRSITRNWAEVRGSGATIHLDLGALAAAIAIILASYALLIGAWRAVLLGWGERLRYPAAARIWCLSNLARYVPGRIWQIAGMAALAQQAGVKPWAAAGSAIIVQLLAVATGALVTGLLVPQSGHPLLIVAAGLAAAVGVGTLAWEPSTKLLVRMLSALGRPFQLAPVAAGPLVVSAAVTTVAWVAYGLALHFCTRGLLGHAAIPVGTAIGVFTGSYLFGLIAVFTPGGLGVREGALYLWLSGPLGPAGATVVSIGSRILMTGTEVLAALITLPLTRRTGDGPEA
jgi:uncharacterized membrane protein YbhN (UPF0104 family)